MNNSIIKNVSQISCCIHEATLMSLIPRTGLERGGWPWCPRRGRRPRPSAAGRWGGSPRSTPGTSWRWRGTRPRRAPRGGPPAGAASLPWSPSAPAGPPSINHIKPRSEDAITQKDRGTKGWTRETTRQGQGNGVKGRAGVKYRFINALQFICSRFNFDSDFFFPIISIKK